MKVLLVNDVKSLGKRGDVVEVKNGFGLNFLLPEGLAILATEQAIKGKDRLLAQFSQEEAEDEAALVELHTKLDGKSVAIVVQAKDGKLFGSVGAKEITEAVKEFDAQIAHSMVVLPKPIKTVGEHEVKIKLGKKTAKLQVSISAE
jgi:large subunit ribosomal protein L9